MAQFGRRHQRRVADLDPLVVFLVARPQAFKDLDGGLGAGFVDEDGLQAPFQRLVLLDILAVLVQGGGADALQLAAGERRFQHVGGVHRTLGGPGADQRVHLVDE